jgi:DNA-binding winged helix-turn-helix (wHTH) protein
MAPTSYRFGPFLLDRVEYCVFREGRALALTSQQFDLLCFLVDHADQLVTKDMLLETLWSGANVTENALTQAISELRHALGDRARTPRYIRTIARRGYRFVARVEPAFSERSSSLAPREPDGPETIDGQGIRSSTGGGPLRSALTGAVAPTTSAWLPEMIVPRLSVRDTPSLDGAKAWTEGWLKIETLDLRELAGALTDFTRAIALEPGHAPFYAGLAIAEGTRYESTRCDAEPDDHALARAIAHARRAVELDDGLAEAHATLAWLLVSAWQTPEAAASARRAVALEPWQWRHQFRLCHAAWGEARVEAAARALALYPAFGFAHFQMAMVCVARGQLAQAQAILLHGVTVQDQQIARRQRFPALGLHWLLGLVLLAKDDVTEAAGEFDREVQVADVHRLYGREYVMSAQLGRAFADMRAGRPEVGLAACDAALRLYPGWSPCHLVRAYGLRALGHEAAAEESLSAADAAVRALERRQPVEGALARAQLLTAQARAEAALDLLAQLLRRAPPGFAAWSLPIDPLFVPLHQIPGFAAVLQYLAERAR